MDARPFPNSAPDQCAFAHLTTTRKSAKFFVQGQEMWQRKAGLPFRAIPCFACPSSMFLNGLLAVPLVKHGNEARVLFRSRVFRSWGLENEAVAEPSRVRTGQIRPFREGRILAGREDSGGTRLSRPGFARAVGFKIEREGMR